MSVTNSTRKPPGLREMTRRSVRAQIASSAMSLFVEHGFEETTVDQIAQLVGISGRSVFRYFATKEDMVLGSLNEIGDRLAEALRERPASESPWIALRRAMDGHLQELRDDNGELLAISQMLARTPSLQAALSAKTAGWVGLLAPEIEGRLPQQVKARQIQACAIATAAIDCLQLAVGEWSATDGNADVVAVLDAAIAAVRS